MSFYSFIRNELDGGDELHIDGEIVSDFDWLGPNGQIIARRFRQRLNQCKDVVVYINSPGGDVFAAAEIYTALREHKGRVTVKITGIAASAASVIAMAGDEVLMSPVAYMMVHDPWTYAAGNYREMEHQAAILKEIGEGLIAAYTAKTGKTRDEIAAMLAAETYMNAQKCVDEGFADGILYELPAAAPEGEPLPSSMMQANRYGASAVLAMVQARERGQAQAKAFGEGIAKGMAHTHHLAPVSGHVHPLGAASAPPSASTPDPTPDPDAALRAEIAQRAAFFESLYE
ncbi:MAG TPA: Clp protease ClpP [Candidatus Ornithocaccomicrobium faecavium]|uniref:ATP-dependent Clp protease proteolytic subunit n=1 Tax=Candidatus Ornithocaccomicrobium faecavium TaxID=2840890 RepID=A0A9D1P9E8_9FIRM|nr:Clp protease ClpP [Candidatus Ornithocaccomicrobium faecavium]